MPTVHAAKILPDEKLVMKVNGILHADLIYRLDATCDIAHIGVSDDDLCKGDICRIPSPPHSPTHHRTNRSVG